ARTKNQPSSKNQFSNRQIDVRQLWDFVFGIYLVLGSWFLVLSRGKLYHARLHASRSSASNFKSTAASDSSSCSGRLAPTIAEVNPGWASTHATATCTSDRPRGSRKRRR